MKLKILSLLSFVVLIVMMVQSCTKTNPPAPQKTMDNLNVPDGFTFETTKEVTLNLQMPSTIDFSGLRSRFDIFTGDPAQGGKLISSGSFDQNGAFTGSIVIPSTLNEVFVKTQVGSVIAPVTNSGGLKEGGVIIDFGGDYANYPPDSLQIGTKTGKANHLSFKGIRDQKVITNLVENGDFSANNFGTMNDWFSHLSVDGKWWFSKDARQGYMEWAQDGPNGYIRTKNSSTRFYGGTSQLIEATPGDLITFSADLKRDGTSGTNYAWLYLIPLSGNGNALNYYSLEILSVPTSWTNKMIAATMPAGTATCQILIWTNDYTTSSRICFDNVVVTGPVSDSDGDGVDDELDDYPNDATRAFNIFYPNETDWGTLAFEDLWPGKGDYDFNDLILDYQYQSVINSNNGLVELFADYSVRAVGASLTNAFGIMIEDSDPANVQSVSGQHFTENYLNIAANGTEENQTNTVIVFFDNAFKMIGSSGSGFINTVPANSYVNPDTNHIHVVFNGLKSRTIGSHIVPYNPFIIVNKDRGTEVHLAGNQPTDLANTSLFGTWGDDSNPATGKYYQSVNNLPWAIDLPVSFDYPVEQVEIINAYNFFADWAESGGVLYNDWYEDLSGYRVAGNIYTPQNN